MKSARNIEIWRMGAESDAADVETLNFPVEAVPASCAANAPRRKRVEGLPATIVCDAKGVSELLNLRRRTVHALFVSVRLRPAV